MAVEDAEPPVVVCRSQTDVRHDLQGRAQTATATWTLPTGTYAIVVCVTGHGKGRCAERPVVVR